MRPYDATVMMAVFIKKSLDGWLSCWGPWEVMGGMGQWKVLVLVRDNEGKVLGWSREDVVSWKEP